MRGSLLRLLVISAVCAAGCGGSDKPVGKPKVVKTKKKDTSALLAQARDNAKSGDIDDADHAYAEAYDLNHEFDVLEERVDFLIHVGRAAKAEEIAKAYYDSNTKDAGGMAIYADALIADYKGEKALDIAEALIALDDKKSAGHEKRGRALVLLERLDEAIEELKKATSLEVENWRAHLALGQALQKQKNAAAAQLELQSALKYEPDDPEVNAYLGAALRDMGELDSAKDALDKALKLDQRSGRAWFELGLLYNVQKKQADAEIALANAVRFSPNESLFWYAYGEIFRLQDRTDDAIKAYRRAVDLDPPYPKAIGKIVQLLVDRKEYDEAERLLTLAVRKDPKNALNYLALGTVYTAKKKTKAAIDAYQKYLELAPKSDPDRSKAKEAIDALKRRG